MARPSGYAWDMINHAPGAPRGAERRWLRAAAAALIVAAATLGGCVDSNQRSTIGTTVKPKALEPGLGTMRENDGPSLVSINRSEWETVVFEVPSDGVGHRPTYRTYWLTDQSNARKRGEFPTAMTAFDTGRSGDWSQTQEAMLAPINSVFDAASIPVLLFVEPQTREQTSPYRAFERTPKRPLMPDSARCCDACEGGDCAGECSSCDSCSQATESDE